MKKIVRILGGALILLVMVVALVSCDDDLLPDGGLNGDLDGWLADLLSQLQVEWPEGVPNKLPNEWPGEWPDELEFNFPERLPSAREATEDMIDSVEDAIVLIKLHLNTAKDNGLNDYDDGFDDLMEAFMNGLLDPNEWAPNHPGITLFQFGLYGGTPEDDISGVTINFDSPEGCFMDVMTQTDCFINMELDSKFTIPENQELPGSYEISLKGARMEAAGVITPLVIDSWLKKKEGDNVLWEKPLAADDVLLEDGNFKWDKVKGADEPDIEPHQRILTLLMSALGPQPEKKAMMKFYFDVEIADYGKFVAGITAVGADGYLYTSAIWESNVNEAYFIAYSNHGDYSGFIVINDKAYELPL
ncbi:MAG: hypothetical protein QM442_07360 [Spirochaetota bacterium]|nr:hypothetical protein [Spirochaetota bacterium]